jgi:putative addiction module component (TIGR02574 family)
MRKLAHLEHITPRRIGMINRRAKKDEGKPSTSWRPAMTVSTEQLRKEALALPLVERAALAEELLSSLDRPDPRIDALWAQEAEDRLAAFEAGEMEAIPAEEVFKELEHP